MYLCPELTFGIYKNVHYEEKNIYNPVSNYGSFYSL